jgi:hypothetical protein
MLLVRSLLLYIFYPGAHSCFWFLSTGQPKFRSMWERYCNGVDAIVYVIPPHSFFLKKADVFSQRFIVDSVDVRLSLLSAPLLMPDHLHHTARQI